MNARLLFALGLFPLATLAVFAQASDRPDIPKRVIDAEDASLARHAARQEVLAAAQAGDFATVRQRVDAGIANRRSRRTLDIDLADELAAVSFNLDEIGESEAAARVSEQALDILVRLQRSRNPDEVVWATFVEATLWERVHHDATKARAAYGEVLKLDPKNDAAIAALVRLDLGDAITEQKMREQEQLLAERDAAEAKP
jgi:hypothetical protein